MSEPPEPPCLTDPPKESEMRLTDEMFAAVTARIEEERGPVAWLRERSTRVRALLLFGVAALTVTGLITAMGAGARVLGAMRSPLWLLCVALLAVAALVAGGAALRPSFRWRLTGRVQAGLLAGLVLGTLASMALVTDGTVGHLGALRCLMVGVAASLPVFGAAVVLDRAPERGLRFGALLAALTGAIAVTALCPMGSLTHVLGQHFGAVAIGTSLLGLAGWAWHRRRA